MIEKQKSVARTKAILKRKKRKNSINIGTWNIRLGIEQLQKRHAIIQTLERRNADIVCVQESGHHENELMRMQPYTLFFPKPSTNELGIIFKSKFQNYIQSTELVQSSTIMAITFLPFKKKKHN
mgnify:CR=1 FL=1